MKLTKTAKHEIINIRISKEKKDIIKKIIEGRKVTITEILLNRIDEVIESYQSTLM